MLFRSTIKTLLDGVQIPDAVSRQVDVPPADLKEPWVTWQVRGDGAAMRAWLSPGKEPKK